MKQEVLTDILDKIIDYRGKTPKKLGGDWSGSGYRALSALQVKTTGLQNLDECHYVDENIYRKWMKEEVKRGDILMTSEAPAGQVFYWDSDEKIVLSQRLFCLKVNNKHNPIYVKYYLQSDTGQKAIFGNLSGSTVSGVSAKTLEYTTIFTRSLGEETKIANVLYSIDKKIDINNKIIKTSEKLMREIYDYWFVQFDFPDENGRPYKSSGGKMIYDENINRKIPDGWRSTKLKGLYKIERGISYSSKDIESSSGTPMINLACVDISRNYRDGGIKLYDGKFSSANVAKANDLIIACTDLTRNADIVGSPILVPDDGREYVFSMDMAKISSFSEELDNMYLYATLRTDYYHSFIKYWASGTNVLHLNLSGLDWYPVWLPPIKLQKTFAEIVRNINANSGLLRKENASLASLRDWLLPILMGGQIKIGD